MVGKKRGPKIEVILIHIMVNSINCYYYVFSPQNSIYKDMQLQWAWAKKTEAIEE
jgi:hypothetical protein